MSKEDDKDPDDMKMPGREKAKKNLDEWTNVHGNNFFGTGMTFQEFMTYGEVERYTRCYHRQDRDERNRRRAYLIKLGSILEKFESLGEIQGTDLLEGWIDNIIEGDKKALAAAVRGFFEPDGVFRDMGEHTKCPHYYRQFFRLLQSCVETWPEDKPDE